MKSLIILVILAAASSSVAGSRYRKAILETNAAWEDLIVGSPEVIKVVFDNGAYLDLGKNITPTESKNQPIIVDWKADSETYYTLMVANPDAPSRKDTYMRNILAWLVGNIPGKDISSGDILAEYIGAATPRNKGMNRYFYFIFRQPGKLQFKEKRIDKYTSKGRINFAVQNFIDKYNLGHPVGFNFFTAYYDPQTEVLYKQMNCCQDLL